MIKFKSLSSGSCGNCYFLGVCDSDGRVRHSIVIDTGVSLRRAKKELQRDGIAVEEIDAVLVTHDHMDHIRSLGSWCKKLEKPVWASETLQQALSHHTMAHPWIANCRRILRKGETEIVPGVISARHFVVPHDATETLGYSLNLDGYRFVLITDCGHITTEALEEARRADTVVVEANYDLYMLRHGPYPKVLQDRICGGNGHLSNAECADSIREFLHPGLRNIFLCHLSEHNNTPELALKAASEAIQESECAPRLIALPRQTPLPITIL